MRVCQLKVITSIDRRDRTSQDFYADLELVAVRLEITEKVLVAFLDIDSVNAVIDSDRTD
jgi:hypothetical protein